MFDFAWSEIMIIGIVALVVIGPKDLPKALRTVGMLVRRARGLAREFQNSVDEMIRESELDEIRRSVQESTKDVDLGAGSYLLDAETGGVVPPAVEPPLPPHEPVVTHPEHTDLQPPPVQTEPPQP
jgi:sec-independent protein translocase protein TatB